MISSEDREERIGGREGNCDNYVERGRIGNRTRFERARSIDSWNDDILSRLYFRDKGRSWDLIDDGQEFETRKTTSVSRSLQVASIGGMSPPLSLFLSLCDVR